MDRERESCRVSKKERKVRAVVEQQAVVMFCVSFWRTRWLDMVTKVTFNFNNNNNNGANGLPTGCSAIFILPSSSSLLAVVNVGFCKSWFEFESLLPSLHRSIISLEHYDFTFYLLSMKINLDRFFFFSFSFFVLYFFIFVPSNGWNFHITASVNTQHQW